MKTAAVKQTKDQIADMIRGDIISGTINGGVELTQEHVAAQTGLSRMPVREAFQTLEQEGFLLRLQNRHMMVIEITQKDIKQYFQTLVTIETLFIKQIFQSGNNGESVVTAISHAVNEQSRENEFYAHKAINVALGNKYLAEIHNKLLDSFYFYALQQHWKKGRADSHLAKIAEAIQEQQENEIPLALSEYFAPYEHALMKGRNQ